MSSPEVVDVAEYAIEDLGVGTIQGPPGPPLNVLGHKNTVGDLPGSGNTTGDAWVVDADGKLYTWGGSSWSSLDFVGPQGDAATVAVDSVVTGAAGTNATVTNEGDSHDARFKFTIPRGNTGAQGDPWDQWKGAWSAGSYLKLDAVSHLGAMWIANKNTSGTPGSSADWDKAADKGADGTGSGDVSGPGSATADHMAVFDGTTGKLIKDGGAVPSVPAAATSAPADLGVAAVGSSAKFAREDHVHKKPAPADIGAVKNQGSAPGLLVLAAAAPVPGGTPSGTVIIRI